MVRAQPARTPPRQPRPYDVLIGRVGVDRLAQQNRDWNALPKDAAATGCRAFAETGQAVCGPILAAWRANGVEIDGRAGTSEAESLALFGLPLSGVLTETLSDGKQYQVQWFERARFELHPENATPHTVLLGLLGSDVRAANTPPPAPPALPAPRCAPVAPSNGTISATCLRGGDPLTLVATTLPYDERVFFLIAAPDGKDYEFVIIYGDPRVQRDGSYRLTGALPPGVPAGGYTLTMRTHKTKAIATFAFGIEAGTPTAENATALPPNVGGATPTRDVARRSIHSVGFNTKETMPPRVPIDIVVVWPDGQAGRPLRVRTNGVGGVSEDLKFISDDDDQIGVYHVIFTVVDTGQQVMVYFRLLPEE